MSLERRRSRRSLFHVHKQQNLDNSFMSHWTSHRARLEVFRPRGFKASLFTLPEYEACQRCCLDFSQPTDQPARQSPHHSSSNTPSEKAGFFFYVSRLEDHLYQNFLNGKHFPGSQFWMTGAKRKKKKKTEEDICLKECCNWEVKCWRGKPISLVDWSVSKAWKVPYWAVGCKRSLSLCDWACGC